MIDLTLTENDINSLKNAHSVAFIWKDFEHATIRAMDSKMIPTSEIMVFSIVSGNDDPSESAYDHCIEDVVGASYHISFAEYSLEWRTIVGLLSPGDTIEIRWSAGGMNSPLLQKHDLVGDLVKIQIHDKDKNFKAMFNLGSIISEKDCTSRIVQFDENVSLDSVS